MECDVLLKKLPFEDDRGMRAQGLKGKTPNDLRGNSENSFLHRKFDNKL